MKIWLDDLRQAPDGWHRTYNARTTIHLLETEDVTEISLDHDLGNIDIVGDGYEVVKHMERMAFEGKKLPKKCYVHSHNPVGSGNMMRALLSINNRFNVFDIISQQPYQA